MAAEMTLDLTRAFGASTVITVRFSLRLDPPSVLILFGPSGAGKTTVLRCLAGLEWPDRGTIKFGDQVWVDTDAGIRVRPQKRHLGCLFQDYALFPTTNVENNIGFGLEGLSGRERRQRIEELLDLFQLRGLEHLKPDQLSGGQQQRVALARAVARRPGLLLLDEPLSALDAQTRLRLRGELRNLLRRLAIPSVVVTHDWEEALALGDHLVVIQNGLVLQTGTPQEVFNRPRNAEVAKIVGMETIQPGRILDASNGLVTVEVNGTQLVAVGSPDEGPDLFVCIRAEDVVLEPAGSPVTSARNRLSGIVRDIAAAGALVRVTVDCGFLLSAVVTRSALSDLQVATGKPIIAAIKASGVHLISRREG